MIRTLLILALLVGGCDRQQTCEELREDCRVQTWGKSEVFLIAPRGHDAGCAESVIIDAIDAGPVECSFGERLRQLATGLHDPQLQRITICGCGPEVLP